MEKSRGGAVLEALLEQGGHKLQTTGHVGKEWGPTVGTTWNPKLFVQLGLEKRRMSARRATLLPSGVGITRTLVQRLELLGCFPR